MHSHQSVLTVYLCDECGPDLFTDHEIGCMHGGYKPVRVYREDAFHIEHKLGDDGIGSHPPNPARDRPATRYMRLVGRWEKL